MFSDADRHGMFLYGCFMDGNRRTRRTVVWVENARDKREAQKGMGRRERERLIFHIDVNSAFLSWECVYRLSQDPEALDLRTIPSAVGGTPV